MMKKRLVKIGDYINDFKYWGPNHVMNYVMNYGLNRKMQYIEISRWPNQKQIYMFWGGYFL